MTIQIIPSGRTDTDDFFAKSGYFKYPNRKAAIPFLVLRGTEKAVAIVLVHYVRDLLTYDDEAIVMSAWVGQYSSDFFQYTVGDVRRALGS